MGVEKEPNRCAICGEPLESRRFSYCEKHRTPEYQYERKLQCARNYYVKHKEQQRVANAERYAWLKSKGYCVMCGHEKASQFSVYCTACAEKNRQRGERYRDKKREKEKA